MPNIKDVQITPDMLNKIAEIDTFNGVWSFENSRLASTQLNTLKRVATIESVGSSNRIEGNKMTDEDIEALFSQINKQSFQSRDEQEVTGYSDLLNTIFDNYQDIPLSENYIKQLHQILLQYSDKDERHRGEYKKDSNAVAAFDASGKEVGTIFETATPFDTPRLMTELVDWTNNTFKDGYFHPIITIGIFIVHFLSIHPFSDGNGRLSRALTLLLMLKEGYSYMPYTSMESIVESSKDSYYRALRGTQKTILKPCINYEPWLSFFVTSLQKQKKVLEDKLLTLKEQNYFGLSETARSILTLFDKKDAYSIAEIANILNKNVETIKKAVQGLVKKEYLIKNGTTKSVFYTLKK